MIMRLFAVAVGLVVVYGSASELVGWFRARRRLRRVPGVIVGDVDASHRPGLRQRAGRFRFTTEDGQVITGVSSASTPRGPRVGKRVTIEYDPARPQDADIAGVKTFKLLLAPLLLIGGLALVFFVGILGVS